MTIQRADSIRVMCPLFQAGEGGSTPTSALQLRFDVADVKAAIDLNRLWHSRLPQLVESNIVRSTNKVCYVAFHSGLFYAVAVWTNPVARSLPHRTWLELRRFAIAPDAPKNTASRMLGWMARDIAARLPAVERLISYQDCDTHAGTIYRAAGWVPVAVGGGGQWNSAHDRKGRKGERVRHKTRWEKAVRPGAPTLPRRGGGRPDVAGLFADDSEALQ